MIIFLYGLTLTASVSIVFIVSIISNRDTLQRLKANIYPHSPSSTLSPARLGGLLPEGSRKNCQDTMRSMRSQPATSLSSTCGHAFLFPAAAALVEGAAGAHAAVVAAVVGALV